MMRYFMAPNRQAFDKAMVDNGLSPTNCRWIRDMYQLKGIRDITIELLSGAMDVPEFSELYNVAQTRNIKMVLLK